jgi:hypothetical protein
LARDNGWTEPPPGTKLKGVELLRTCQRMFVFNILLLHSQISATDRRQLRRGCRHTLQHHHLCHGRET